MLVFFQSTHPMQSCLDARVDFHSQHHFHAVFNRKTKLASFSHGVNRGQQGVGRWQRRQAGAESQSGHRTAEHYLCIGSVSTKQTGFPWVSWELGRNSTPLHQILARLASA